MNGRYPTAVLPTGDKGGERISIRLFDGRATNCPSACGCDGTPSCFCSQCALVNQYQSSFGVFVTVTGGTGQSAVFNGTWYSLRNDCLFSYEDSFRKITIDIAGTSLAILLNKSLGCEVWYTLSGGGGCTPASAWEEFFIGGCSGAGSFSANYPIQNAQNSPKVCGPCPEVGNNLTGNINSGGGNFALTFDAAQQIWTGSTTYFGAPRTVKFGTSQKLTPPFNQFGYLAAVYNTGGTLTGFCPCSDPTVCVPFAWTQGTSGFPSDLFVMNVNG